MSIDSDTIDAETVTAISGIGQQVWDGHGEAGHVSPAELMRELLSYEAPDIGEVFVLTPRTRLGEATLTIRSAERWEVSLPVPADCNLLEDDECPLDGSEDTVTRTMPELVAELIEYHGLGEGMDEGDTIEAEITYWRQDAPQAFRLDLAPCEMPAATAEAEA